MPYSSEWLLQLLQRFLKNSAKIQQIHALLITDDHLLNKPQAPSNPKWISSLLYNALIRAYLSFNRPCSTLILYTQMLAHRTKPNAHTFPSIIKSATISSPLLGKLIHAHAVKIGVVSDPFVLTSFVSFYAELRELGNARKVFDEITDPCIVAFNSLLDAFVKNGDMGSAVLKFRSMKKRDVVSWTSIVHGFWWNGRFLEAIGFFEMMMMNREVKPNEATYVSVLSSCANLAAEGVLCRGKEIHAYIIRNEGELSAFIGTALVDFYGKMGLLGSARTVFNQMKNRELCAWNAMISSLSSNGRGREALELFASMKVEGIRPNEVTFVAILTACARGKLVESGLELFRSMSNDFLIVPIAEHYVCMVDLLAKAGLLREATEFIESMPFQPDASVLGALLNACNIHGATELGNEVGRRLLVMQPRHCGRYVTLASINARAEKWSRAAVIRRVMADARIQKAPAYSRVDPMQNLVPMSSS
ncbi:putative pentatricopeptide repeat-containing protein At1g10330 [Cucurbita maxima]|uniref:Pentatricopeptide repeat-containing protein At1g10330 n=1 Tax=Cucurbita maxima TaxID=3661 RepID=A0A6J1JN92_CUCMA|nr:putative pentatricopeptide repeat-containing protein At1g10330 [Cucurbita maxima]XP_022988763.1 putative pentatricopeptide repeat-containing protein At1g10330 [Cucurbita maxima]